MIADIEASLEPRVNKKLKTAMKYAAEVSAMLVLLFLFYAYQSNGLLQTGELPAPPLSATLLDGTSYDLRDNPAQATLIYFFAPWCSVCAASSGNIEYLRKLRSDDGLEILLVALDWETGDEVQAYVDKHEISVPVLLGNASIARDWNIYAFPTYYMLDSLQRVAHRDLGYSTLAGLWLRSVALE